MGWRLFLLDAVISTICKFGFSIAHYNRRITIIEEPTCALTPTEDWGVLEGGKDELCGRPTYRQVCARIFTVQGWQKIASHL